MFDAVGAPVDRRRPAIGDRRMKRRDGMKLRTGDIYLDNGRRRGLFDRERIFLDRSGKETHRHRAAIEVASMGGKRRARIIAIRGEFLERAMVGRLFRPIHRLAIRDARRPRTVQTDEYHHEQSKETNFERTPIH